jgi:hypothetical protein
MIHIQPPVVQNWNSLVNKPSILSDNQISWDEIQNKPTTLTGYGITNALALTGGTITGDLVSTSATVSTSPNTGALRVASLGITGAIFAGTLNGNGSGLTTLNASNIATGTLADTCLPTRLGSTCQFITNWNNAVTNGFYQGANITNAPTAGWYMGEVIAHDSLYVTQKVHKFDDDSLTNSQLYKRNLNNGIWTSWARVLENEDELDVRYVNKAGGTISLNATQVVSTRRTGWTAPTGTPTRTTFTTSTVTLTGLAERVKALIDDLIAHGLIGA